MRLEGNLLHLHKHIKKRAVSSRLYSAGQYTRTSPKATNRRQANRLQKPRKKEWLKNKRSNPRATTDHDRGLVTTQIFRQAHTHPHRHPSLRQLPPWRKCLASQFVGGPYQV